MQEASLVLGPAQAVTFPVTARMPNTVAAFRAGAILRIHFEVHPAGGATRPLAREASTFIVPR